MARIAVVDNDPMFLQLLSDLLEDRGLEVVTYPEAPTTLAVLRAEPPDLILFDLRAGTPTLGWGMLRQLHLDLATRNIPVIVCSGGQSHLTDKERRLLKRVTTVLPKPFDIEDLYQSVEAALQRIPTPT